MVGEKKCHEMEQKQGVCTDKKEMLNTKLKTGCLEEKRRHKKTMPSRLNLDITRRKK